MDDKAMDPNLDPSTNMLKEALNDHTDCFGCRLLSTTGFLFGGLFILKNRKNFGKVNELFQTLLGAGFVGASFFRVFGLPPFQVKSDNGLLFKL